MCVFWGAVKQRQEQDERWVRKDSLFPLLLRRFGTFDTKGKTSPGSERCRCRLPAINSNRILHFRMHLLAQSQAELPLNRPIFPVSLMYPPITACQSAEVLREYFALLPHFKDGEAEAQRVSLACNWTYAGRHQ